MEIGQTIYLRPINNQQVYGNDTIKETTITKIGRKYFEVKNSQYKFSIDFMYNISNYTPSWKAYLSKQEILDTIERENLIKKFKDYFLYKNNLSLQKLKDIDKIINESI